MRKGRLKRLALERFDGEPVVGTPWEDLLVEIGFRQGISTQYVESLDRIGELAQGQRRGWSVPKVRRDYLKTVLAIPAYGVLRWWRLRLPGQAGAMIRSGRCEALMCHELS